MELVSRAAPYLARHGSASPRLDAEVLLAHALGLERMELYLQFERPLTVAEVDAFRALCRRRAGGEPVAYIRGRKEFMSVDLVVTPAVLIPRPETEVLVEEALRRLRAAVAAGRAPRLLDVGTGSGAIAVAVAVHEPAASVLGTDISAAALEVARQNVERLELGDRVELREADLVAGVEGRFDVVAANLPYIDPAWEDAVAEDVAATEPAVSLYGGVDGLDHIGRLLQGLSHLLAPGGAALLEFDPRQAAPLLERARAVGRVAVLQDLAGLDRVLVVDDVAVGEGGA
ncbi:MAG: release factor glutamine methyltransferase [Chloroflexota bacterium]|nr:release factor glutamine methyltransferase [Chloroflexota bacterium]